MLKELAVSVLLLAVGVFALESTTSAPTPAAVTTTNTTNGK